jgi:hypothetical protein
MKRYGLQDNFLPGIPGVLRRCGRLDDLMVVCLPRLALFFVRSAVMQCTHCVVRNDCCLDFGGLTCANASFSPVHAVRVVVILHEKADQGIQSSTMFASSWFIALFGVRVSEAISGRYARVCMCVCDGWAYMLAYVATPVRLVS